MSKVSLQPPPLTAILIEIANLDEVAFEKLKADVEGPNGLDTDKERVLSLASLLDLDSTTAGLIMTGLSFIDTQLKRSSPDLADYNAALRELIPQLIDLDSDEIDETLSEETTGIITDRLMLLLDNGSNVERYNKHERLRWGFLPAALSFSTFVDLRPNMADDMTKIDELIPIIQFRIHTDSKSPMLENFVFQLDTRSLKKLRDEVERAERKIGSIQNNDALKTLITKRRP